MAVLGLLKIALAVPDLQPGLAFYTKAGLNAAVDGQVARLSCDGQDRPSVELYGGAPRKVIHHLSLRADDLTAMAKAIPQHGGRLIDAPAGCGPDGLWLEDPHGLRIQLVERPADPPLAAGAPFAINAPGSIVRNRRSAILARHKYPPVRPLRLGHVLLFTPDVPASVHFLTEALGMALADRAQDIIAFCCCRHNSDHHVIAFAKSPGIGFHHASFQVADPDEVGRAGADLRDSAESGRPDRKGNWGFGRHTIGSNFFHYVQDPWGSWFEYYADIDYIDDYALWTPTNYGLEDSLSSWGPKVPDDFVHNYELDC